MQAIEFITNSHNGVIEIPASYKDWYHKTVKVILLRETSAETSDTTDDTNDLSTFFEQFNADLTHFRFNRDEIHER